ncbi:MAG: alanyl-tRNA editing protein [Clostridia bacterium]|nr:alanyl-tRNA editing protein [Clostridia bacterium]
MSTEKLYDADSHLTEFSAKVLSCEPCKNGFAVILDKTAFFPEAGGQASDRGTLGEAAVTDVQIDGTDVLTHFLDRPLAVGETVTGKINWERRFDFMQQHSGEHIVSGVAHTLYGVENVGFHLGEDIVTLDFDRELTAAELHRIETLANEKVFENVAFRTYYPDEETLKNLSYRSKKELNGAVRIVEIENTDRCACCAPHVNSAAEVGLIKLLDTERLRGGIRIQLKCGRRALADYNEKYQNVRKIGALLSVKQTETAEATQHLNDQLSAEKQKNAALKKRMAEQIIAVTDGAYLFVEDFEMKELQLLADGLHRKTGNLHAVFTPNGEGTSFSACGEETVLNGWLADLKNRFPVRGGGRGGMVSGTVAISCAELQKEFAKAD